MTKYAADVSMQARRQGGGAPAWIMLAASVGAAVNTGVFVAFSFFIMPAVRDLSSGAGIEAMQALNRFAPAPFTIVGFGTAVLCVVVMAYGARTWRTASGRWLLGGAVLYLIAAIVVTFAASVPISYTIDTLDPSSTNAGARWDELYTQWIWANHLRALGSLGAAVALVTGLRSQR